MRTTDMADELFSGATQPLPAGVRLATARHGGVTVTRVEIAREGLSRPRGRYVTLEMPSVSVLDERDAAVIEVCARELRALLPPEGPVLVLGVGNRRITADALGPRTVQRILVTMGAGAAPPVRGLRPVAAVAPGGAAGTGLSPQQFITRMRMEKACEMLDKTDLPVREIAEWMDYEYQSHFTKQFRKEMGLSPTEYRER